MENRSSINPIPQPLINKRAGNVGSDLSISFVTDLFQCEILPTEKRLISSGLFSAGVYLCFNTPFYFFNLYPGLLIQKGPNRKGMPLVLMMFK